MAGKTRRNLQRPEQSELFDLYYNQERSVQNLADLYGVYTSTIRGWMDFYNMPRREQGEATRLYYRRQKECPLCGGEITAGQIHSCWGD